MGKITIKINFLSNNEVTVSIEKDKDIVKASNTNNNLKLKPSDGGIGRPSIDFPDNWIEVYNQWKRNEITATKAMQELQLKRNTFYRLVQKHELIKSNEESQEAEEAEEIGE